jgi:hypothetical protein
MEVRSVSGAVSSVLARLAVIERTLLNPVNNAALVAYDNVPVKISAIDMPLFVNFVGPLISKTPAGNDDRAREFTQVRNYSAVLYYAPFPSGIDEESFGGLTPFFDTISAKIGGVPRLNNLGGVVGAELIADSGMTVVEFGGAQYYGIRFTIQITTRHRYLLEPQN